MPVILAYLIVVIIWSTTPLGIVWSNDSVSPTLAVLSRMVIGLVLALLFLLFTRIPLPRDKQALRLYCYSGFGVFGGMLFSYMAAQSLSSGMMSLVFGLAPLLSGLLAQKILDEPAFGWRKKLALFIALTGLVISCSDSLLNGQNQWSGLLLILVAVVIFSLSGVMIKSLKISIHPIATTAGSLLFSVPLFLLCWLVMDGEFTLQHWSLKSSLSIVYLGVFASFIGFVAYFYILQKLSASTVALVTLLTPVFALLLGNQLNGEQISLKLLLGASLILTGLSLYQWTPKAHKT